MHKSLYIHIRFCFLAMTIKKLYLRCITRTSSLLYCSSVHNTNIYIMVCCPITSSSRDPSYNTNNIPYTLIIIMCTDVAASLYALIQIIIISYVHIIYTGTSIVLYNNRKIQSSRTFSAQQSLQKSKVSKPNNKTIHVYNADSGDDTYERLES